MNLQLRSDDDGVVPSPLPEAAGYVVVVAVGLVFAVGVFPPNINSLCIRAKMNKYQEWLE